MKAQGERGCNIEAKEWKHHDSDSEGCEMLLVERNATHAHSEIYGKEKKIDERRRSMGPSKT